MQIRPFTPADTEAVLAIWLEASLQAHHFIEPAYWHANLAPMREIYLPAADSQLLCLGEQVLGFYSLHEHAKQQLPTLRLQVYQQNRAACDFYRAQGFQVAAEGVDPHTGCAEWVMVWPARG